MRIRGLFITLILALSAAIGFLAEKDLKIEFANVTLHYAMFVPLGGIVGTLLFYFIDRYWYHRLLVGTVNQGLLIERRYRFELPELALSDAISEASPIRLNRFLTKLLAKLVVKDKAYRENKLIHSNAKIELFYKPIVYIFFVVFLLMMVTGGVLVGKLTLIDIAVRGFSAIQETAVSKMQPSTKKPTTVLQPKTALPLAPRSTPTPPQPLGPQPPTVQPPPK